MPPLRITKPESVLAAVDEFNAIGRASFLSKYGFGEAREYFLLLDGSYYDSKAICGVAHGHENPESGPLTGADFTGGEKTVARKLESLGFTVIRRRTEGDAFGPLVLVENEVTVGGRYDHWQDKTGATYNYPNQYRNRIRTGRPFVYYRGVRRKGGDRGAAEYFGVGRIGEIWRDASVHESEPPKSWKWFCSIDAYVPFTTPVPAKVRGRYFEDISTPLGWRTGVREISQQAFETILSHGNVDPSEFTTKISEVQASLPIITDVRPVVRDALEEILMQAGKGLAIGRASYLQHRSRHSKISGDRAEEIVYRWLRASLPERQADSVDWPARRGEAPGWDIQYRDAEGQLIAVEVKGTTSPGFTYVELTGNEWMAAEELRENYHLYLVASCLGKSPTIVFVRDPFGEHLHKRFEVKPASWRLALARDAV